MSCTMYPSSYHHSSFVVIHALGPKCMSCYKAIVVITRRAHCFRDYIYITPILLIYIYIYIYIYITYIYREKELSVHSISEAYCQ